MVGPMNYWVCKTRLKLLTDFREVFGEYADVVEAEVKLGERPDWTHPVLSQLRNQLSRDVDAVQQALDDVGVGQIVGYRKDNMISVVVNVFDPRVGVMPWQVIHHVERGIGIYKRRKWPSLLQTVNPFYWIGELIGLLVREVVFRPFGVFLGKDVRDVAGTPLGRATLLALQIVGNLGSIAGPVLAVLFGLDVL